MELRVRRLALVAHHLVVERQKIIWRGIVENGRAQPVEKACHTRSARIVVGRKLEKVRIVPRFGVVLFCTVKRAECHVLLDVESEGLFGCESFAGSVQLRPNLVVAARPKGLPTQNLGIFEQQPPKADEIAVSWTLILRSSSEQLIELAIAGRSPFHGDAAFASLRPAEFTETADAFRRPSAADHIVDRTHAFAAPREAVHFT